MVDGDNDGGGGFEVLGNAHVHAELGRTGIEIVDLGELTFSECCNSNKARESLGEPHFDGR